GKNTGAMTPCSSMSSHTKERVTMIKVTLENFYSNLIVERISETEGLCPFLCVKIQGGGQDARAK
uniref:Uncharacterized protein n=1 Tax=Capra hircus TaxID=9925 RepID=A0A8C2RUF2_CAPHI